MLGEGVQVGEDVALRRVRGGPRRHGDRRRLRDRGPRGARQAPAAGAPLERSGRGERAGARARARASAHGRGRVRRARASARRRSSATSRSCASARASAPRSVIGRGSVVDNDVADRRARAGADQRLPDGVHGRRGRRVRRAGRVHDQRRHDGPPRPGHAAARRDPAPRLPRRRRRGARRRASRSARRRSSAPARSSPATCRRARSLSASPRACLREVGDEELLERWR